MAPARTALPVACALLAGAAVAQQPSSPQGPPAPATAPRCYDFVAAMVGNKAILASQVTDWWRERMKEDEQRPRGTAAKPHALWGYLLEALITREIEAQSARLIGRAPDEIEALVERLVQENINQQAESFGGLNAFARELGAIGRSMGSFAEEARADIMRSIAYYQGVLRELHDQRAMLATPKEMKALFDADPDRFHAPARVKVAFVRVAHGSDPAAAAAQAEATAARWRELPRPVDEAALRERGADVLEIVPDRETTPALRSFGTGCQPGDVGVSRGAPDDPWAWVLCCLERTEARRARFTDPDVQARLRDEIASKRWNQIVSRLFPENRVGVRRLPWGEPALMEQRLRPDGRR